MTETSYRTVATADGQSFNAYCALPASGSGPGLVLLQEIFGINHYMRDMAQMYAEEGYVVLVPDLFWRIEPGLDLGYDDTGMARAMDCFGKFDVALAVTDIGSTVAALRAMPEHVGGVGALGYCLGGKLAVLAAAHTDVDCAISYYGVGVHDVLEETSGITAGLMFHFAENDVYCPPAAQHAIRDTFGGAEFYFYPGVDHAFGTHGRDSYHKPSAMMAYSRTLALLRSTLGPHYNLSELWDKHCEYEFATRDVPATMATMVAEPYVNHIPTMTGGVGYKELSRFYQHHFVNANPADTTLTPISRTIGADRVVDEMLFSFTHDREIDWMLPGIAPTGRFVEIPMLAVVTFRGDKLYHEHIYWDQASVLVQIGVLDPSGLPVAGVATAKKLIDESLPSNELMNTWATSA
jgi:carboxymethylenebutenolidase